LRREWRNGDEAEECEQLEIVDAASSAIAVRVDNEARERFGDSEPASDEHDKCGQSVDMWLRYEIEVSPREAAKAAADKRTGCTSDSFD
jgi:hypothetical protein